MQAGEVRAEALAREHGGGDHPSGDGRAVRQGVAGGGLEGVADGVAVVEDGAETRLELVLGDDPGLEANGVQDQGAQGFGVPGAGRLDEVQVVEVGVRRRAAPS